MDLDAWIFSGSLDVGVWMLAGHEPFGFDINRFNVSRSSRERGGLLSTPSTFSAISPSSFINAPQPVSRMFGVQGDSLLRVLATWRPSRYGIPRSVIPTSNGSPRPRAARNAVNPAPPL